MDFALPILVAVFFLLLVSVVNLIRHSIDLIRPIDPDDPPGNFFDFD